MRPYSPSPSLTAILTEIARKQDFAACATVHLRDWRDLERASSWCASEAQERFRRYVRSDDKVAWFDLEGSDDAFYFKFAFG